MQTPGKGLAVKQKPSIRKTIEPGNPGDPSWEMKRSRKDVTWDREFNLGDFGLQMLTFE
jgi:hypothetical protein